MVELRGRSNVMTIWKKIENFWYYYKWYVLGAAFIIGSISFLMINSAQKPDPDLTVCYIGHSTSQFGAEEMLDEKLAPYLTDVNGDGERHIEWLELTFAADDLQKKNAVEAQIPALVAAGECKLFLVDRTYADSLTALGAFADEAIPLEDVTLFAECGIDTRNIFAGVRVEPLKMSDFHEKTLENARAVYNLIKNEKKT